MLQILYYENEKHFAGHFIKHKPLISEEKTTVIDGRGFQHTLQKKEVCAQQNVPAKRFKICYILCIRKPM